jgi:hypothetical protein
MLALLNKTPLLKLLQIPSIFILFSTILFYYESVDIKLDKNILIDKLDTNKFTDPDNNWEIFFLMLIILALIRRVIIFFLINVVTI